jgi:hypothetical protein
VQRYAIFPTQPNFLTAFWLSQYIIKASLLRFRYSLEFERLFPIERTAFSHRKNGFFS